MCSSHKLEGMINVTSRRCNKTDCVIRASQNYPNKYSTPVFCSKHKLDGMIDVVNKRCRVSGCKTRPSYGVPGGTKTNCAKHKEPEMIYLRNVKKEEPITPITTSKFRPYPILLNPNHPIIDTISII
jgi:hypothetical protein